MLVGLKRLLFIPTGRRTTTLDAFIAVIVSGDFGTIDISIAALIGVLRNIAICVAALIRELRSGRAHLAIF
jgi:hypothetical protein